jgi:hypothetical protein
VAWKGYESAAEKILLGGMNLGPLRISAGHASAVRRNQSIKMEDSEL